jgi:hypothetical protein
MRWDEWENLITAGLLTDTAGDMGGRDVMKEGVIEADVVELDLARWEFETGGCVYIYCLREPDSGFI